MENGQGLIGWIGHMFSGITLAGAIVGWFPGVAALVALAWYTIQIYESKTFQRWKTSRRLRQIAKLKVEMARLEALELVEYPDNRVAIAAATLAAEDLLKTARKEAKVVVENAKDKS
jgi:hypothetical protein